MKLLLAVLLTLPAFAQLSAPNPQGVSAGHHIISTTDLDKSMAFWTALGGEPAALGPLKLTKFPGVLLLIRKGEPKGGTEGSSIDALGFKVKNLKESLARWEPAGIKPMAGATKKEAYILGPDGIKLHIVEDSTLAHPIECSELRMASPHPSETKEWYAKWFGPHIPGAEVVVEQAKGEVAGTKGRAFDRVGLEVTDLEETVKRLQDSGAKFDGPIRKAGNMALAVAILTDPWGTYIEISQGLAAVK
jgi:hypothetical protein